MVRGAIRIGTGGLPRIFERFTASKSRRPHLRGHRHALAGVGTVRPTAADRVASGGPWLDVHGVAASVRCIYPPAGSNTASRNAATGAGIFVEEASSWSSRRRRPPSAANSTPRPWRLDDRVRRQRANRVGRRQRRHAQLSPASRSRADGDAGRRRSIAFARELAPDLVVTTDAASRPRFGAAARTAPRRSNQGDPVMMLSARASENRASRDLAGADDYLVKLFSAANCSRGSSAALRMTPPGEETPGHATIRAGAVALRSCVDPTMCVRDGERRLPDAGRQTGVGQSVAMRFPK